MSTATARRVIVVAAIRICLAAAMFVAVGWVAGRFRFPEWLFYTLFALTGVVFIVIAIGAALQVQALMQRNKGHDDG